MRFVASAAFILLSTSSLVACDHGSHVGAPLPASTQRAALDAVPAPAGQILWFDREPRAGYEWSFFLYLPSGVTPDARARAPLLVMPNNTGTTDDQAGVHRAASLKQIFSWQSYAEKLQAVLLVPTFPRPAARPDLYTHALDRDTLLVTSGELRRLDFQLIAMVDAAQRFLGASSCTQA